MDCILTLTNTQSLASAALVGKLPAAGVDDSSIVMNGGLEAHNSSPNLDELCPGNQTLDLEY